MSVCVSVCADDAISQSDSANFCCVFSRYDAYGCHFMTASPFVVCHCAAPRAAIPAASPPVPSPNTRRSPCPAGSLFSALCAKLFGHWQRPIALKSNVKCLAHAPLPLLPLPLSPPQLALRVPLLVRNICRINFKFSSAFKTKSKRGRGRSLRAAVVVVYCPTKLKISIRSGANNLRTFCACDPLAAPLLPP